MERDGVLIIAVVLAAAIILGNFGEQTGNIIRISPPVNLDCWDDEGCPYQDCPPGQSGCCKHDSNFYNGHCECCPKQQTPTPLNPRFNEERDSSRGNPGPFSRLLSQFFRNDHSSSSSSYGLDDGGGNSQQQSSTPRDTPVVKSPKPTKPACGCVYAQSCSDDPQGNHRYCKRGGCTPSGNQPNVKTGMCVKREGIRPVRET